MSLYNIFICSTLVEPYQGKGKGPLKKNPGEITVYFFVLRSPFLSIPLEDCSEVVGVSHNSSVGE